MVSQSVTYLSLRWIWFISWLGMYVSWKSNPCLPNCLHIQPTCEICVRGWLLRKAKKAADCFHQLQHLQSRLIVETSSAGTPLQCSPIRRLKRQKVEAWVTLLLHKLASCYYYVILHSPPLIISFIFIMWLFLYYDYWFTFYIFVCNLGKYNIYFSI